jgi:thioredoxin-related protein
MSISPWAAARALAGALVLSASAAAGGEGWVADYDQAVKLARAANKDLFVDFTGSDWCGWCKKLDAEVFSKDEFRTWADKEFVLVSLDFPKSEEALAKVPNPKRNEELRDQHGVSGFPTVLLMTADGEAYASTGYRPGGAAEYVKHLGELKTSAKKELELARKLIEAWKAAPEGEAKLLAWDGVAQALAGSAEASFAARQLAPVVRTALEFDADNAQGRKQRAVEALLAGPHADAAVIAAAKELDPKNEAGLLEKALKAQFQQIESEEQIRAALQALDDAAALLKDPATSFLLNAYAASLCVQYLDDLPRAKTYAQRAKEIGSEDERAMAFVEQVLGS